MRTIDRSPTMGVMLKLVALVMLVGCGDDGAMTTDAGVDALPESCAQATTYQGQEVDCTFRGGPGVCVPKDANDPTPTCYQKCSAPETQCYQNTRFFTTTTDTGYVCYCR